jgi:hypothetical protein
MANAHSENSDGKFHDQGDAKWIVIREQLRGHNNTPFGRPTPPAAYRPPLRRIWWLGTANAVSWVSSFLPCVLASFRPSVPLKVKEREQISLMPLGVLVITGNVGYRLRFSLSFRCFLRPICPLLFSCGSSDILKYMLKKQLEN